MKKFRILHAELLTSLEAIRRFGFFNTKLTLVLYNAWRFDVCFLEPFIAPYITRRFCLFSTKLQIVQSTTWKFSTFLSERLIVHHIKWKFRIFHAEPLKLRYVPKHMILKTKWTFSLVQPSNVNNPCLSIVLVTFPQRKKRSTRTIYLQLWEW